MNWIKSNLRQSKIIPQQREYKGFTTPICIRQSQDFIFAIILLPSISSFKNEVLSSLNPSFGLQVHLVISPDDFTSPAQDLPFALTYYCMTRIRHCKASRQHPITKVVRKDMAYNCWARGNLQLFPNCFGHSGGMCQSVLFGVINNLCIYMLIGAKYSQTWPFRGSIQLPNKDHTAPPPSYLRIYTTCV